MSLLKPAKHYNCGKDNPMFGTRGGMYGKKHSEETKEKLRQNLLGNKRRLGIPHSEETKKKFAKFGDKNPNWKNGQRLIHGRMYIYKPDHPYAGSKGCVLRSRLIAEKALGRFLKPHEIVHHFNKNKLDDRNENLMVCTQSFHVWLHNKLRWSKC